MAHPSHLSSFFTRILKLNNTKLPATVMDAAWFKLMLNSTPCHTLKGTHCFEEVRGELDGI